MSRAGRTAESQAVQGPGNASSTPLEPAELKRLGEFPNAAKNPDEERGARELASGTTATNQNILDAIQAGKASSSSSAADADETTKVIFCGFNFLASSITMFTISLPATLCITFGRFDFMRVPLPADKIIIEISFIVIFFALFY